MEISNSLLKKSTSLVSIIVPCFNYGWILAETLDSILAQTHKNWECIIINDGSTDDTQIVAERYQDQDARFRYVYQENGGLSAARNHGLRLVQGKYIQFLDADDLLASRKLAIQATYLDAHPEVDLTYGDVRYFRHGEPNELSRSLNMQDTHWMVGVEGQGEVLLKGLLQQNIMVVTAPLLRAALLSKTEPFAEDLRSMEDWDFWVRCALNGAYFHYDDTPDTWSLVRVHATSMSQDLTKMFKFEVMARLRIQKILEKHNYTSLKAVNASGISFLVDALTEFARRKMSAGNKRQGIKDYLYLAKTTGRYLYYLRNMVYWLRKKDVSIT
jgi:glycosyltransferase involved in cell wall biosynthesis